MKSLIVLFALLFLAASAQTAPTPSTLPPIAATASVGKSLTFTVTTPIGDPPFTYQWRKNGVNINGAILQSFGIVAAAVTDTGVYDVVVSNAIGSALSNQATIAVGNAPGSPSVTVTIK